MILYHGTNIDFQKISLSKSKPNKDFGQGFYLSAELQQAEAMENIQGMTMEQAMNEIFSSDTYRKLMNDKTQLYHQSARYVYAFLEEEMRSGKIQ